MDGEVTPGKAAERTCLKCNTKFPSKGPGNRICRRCNRINTAYGPIPEAVLAKQRGSKRHNGLIIDDTADIMSE